MSVHKVINGPIDHNNRDCIYKYRLSYIDLVAASTNIIEYVDEWHLVDFNKIIFTDHQEFFLDMNLKEYYKVK